MYLTITLEPHRDPFSLPVQYNRHLQSTIYRGLSKEVGGFFHDTGFEYESRRFKLFTFSRIIGKGTLDKANSALVFSGPISFVVSSPIKQFCSSLATGLLKMGNVQIASEEFSVSSVQVAEPKIETSSILVRCLSPVTVYSTMTRYDGTKYTVYFDPREPEFGRLVLSNLSKKYELLVQEGPPGDPPFGISPRGTPKLAVLEYKGTIIKGYTCRFLLEGPRDLLQVALDAGIGSKNSQGFGCIVPDHPIGAKDVFI